jgi:CRISPR-associated endonuclease/helicase Cas3
MKKFESKLERIYRFEQILIAHPEGLTRAEIARRLGTHRSTISRYLVDCAHILPLWEDAGRIGMDRSSYLNNVKLNIHEIMVLHLAARLFSCRTDKFNPHACSAMRKLGHALGAYSKIISDYIVSTADYIEKQSKKYDRNFITILEKLTSAWSGSNWVSLSYYSQKENKIHLYDFATYFIQPYAVGFTLYAIGFCKQKNHIVTFKVERIKDITVLKEQYSIPKTFNTDKLFKDAWGIWYSDSEPVEVVLEFSQQVAGRVAETVWHQSQQIEKQENGGVIWKAKIAEPLELYPWIRGWGSDVKIVRPEGLRRRHIADLKASLEGYGRK